MVDKYLILALWVAQVSCRSQSDIRRASENTHILGDVSKPGRAEAFRRSLVATGLLVDKPWRAFSNALELELRTSTGIRVLDAATKSGPGDPNWERVAAAIDAYSSGNAKDENDSKIDNATGLESHPYCGLDSINTREPVRSNAINLYMLQFPQDATTGCAKTTELDACKAARRSCVTIENTIFCDGDLALNIAKLATAVHLQMYLQIIGELKDTNGQEFYARLDARLMSAILNRDYSSLGAMLQADACSVTRIEGVIMNAMIAVIAGHEFAHVEEHSCKKIDVPILPREDLTFGLTLYRQTTCTLPSESEFFADVRSAIRIARSLQFAPIALNYIPPQTRSCPNGKSPMVNDETHFEISAKLESRPDIAILLATAALMEYQVLVVEPEVAERVAEEPSEADQLFEYYRPFARIAARTDSTSPSGHPSAAYRALLFMGLGGYRSAMMHRNIVSDIEAPLARLHSLVVGNINGMNELHCPKSEPRLGDASWQFFMSPTEGSDSTARP